MRIVFISPGTGGFHCGSCMRDNALAVAMRKRGHDALMVPLYLPPTLDEAQATISPPIFYGGVNVYLQQKLSLFRTLPKFFDRFLDSKGVLKAAARKAGMTHPSQLGELTLSMLHGENGRQKKELDFLSGWLAAEGTTDVVILSNALLIGLARSIAKSTGARIFCTLQGEDTFIDSLGEPYATQCWHEIGEASRCVEQLFPVSDYYGSLMIQRAGLKPEQVRTLHNGIDLSGYPNSPGISPADPNIGYFARLHPIKGLGDFVEAALLFIKGNPGLVRQGWTEEIGKRVRFTIGGSMTESDSNYVNELKRKIDASGLTNRFSWQPNVNRDEKIALLQSLTLLSVPATYGESFGLYVVESMAAGTPVVQPDHAAFPELIQMSGGGLLHKPNDSLSLTTQWTLLVAHPERRELLAKSGHEWAHKYASIDVMADKLETILAQPK